MLKQQKQKESKEPKEVVKSPADDLSTDLSKTIEDAFVGPAGFNKAVQELKNNLENNNQEQISVLREQVTKLTELISVTQDSLRISERIANEIG